MKKPLLIACFCASVAFAQQTDSTRLFMSGVNEEKVQIKHSTAATDTVLDNLHNYYQTGVLGNIGLPSYSLLVNGSQPRSFFNWMNLNNNADMFSNTQPLYFYPAGKVYTKIFAAMGQKQEQVFKILHSQNINRVNISLAFNRYSCLGFYNLQKSLTDNLLLSSHSRTKKGRVGYNFYFLFNKLKYQLNGGIDTSKVDFSESVLVDKKLFPVKLTAAKQNLRTAEANLNLFLRLNKDSAAGNHYLVYEGNYQNNYWLYADGFSDSAYYANTYYYIANTGSRDSVGLAQVGSSLYYRFTKSRLSFYAGYKHEFSHYNQVYLDTLVQNHLAIGGLGYNTAKQTLSINASYAAAGLNRGNYSVNAGYKLYLTKHLFINSEINAGSYMPSMMSQLYYSSHFVWNDTFSNTISQNLRAELGSDKYHFRMGFYAKQTQGLVYFDTLALPEQEKAGITQIRLYAEKNFKMGPIHLVNSFNFQQVSNEKIIRLPQLYTLTQLYYEGKLFKKNLWLQAGVQVRYVSAFKANAYMPATNQFYLQNMTEYGNYIFGDIFINARIERFSFFLLASHANQGLSGGNYMLSPTYAMPDRSLKAGLSWMFFN